MQQSATFTPVIPKSRRPLFVALAVCVSVFMVLMEGMASLFFFGALCLVVTAYFVADYWRNRQSDQMRAQKQSRVGLMVAYFIMLGVTVALLLLFRQPDADKAGMVLILALLTVSTEYHNALACIAKRSRQS